MPRGPSVCIPPSSGAAPVIFFVSNWAPGTMIKEQDIQKVRGGILVGIYTGGNILNFVTTERLLRSCLRALHEQTSGLRWKKLGSFGKYPVTLVVPASEPPSLFVDGPVVAKPRNLSAAVTLDKARLVSILAEALRIANPQTGTNGRQPLRSERKRTSVTAASRRSP